MASLPLRLGVVFGVLLILFGAVFLCHGPWGAGRIRDQWLADREKTTVTIDPQVANPRNDGKLVHVTGMIDPQEQDYSDSLFRVSARGFALVRLASSFGYAGGDGGRGDGWYPDRRPSVAGGAIEASDPSRTVVWVPTRLRVGTFVLDTEIVLRWLHEETGVVSPPAREYGRELFDEDRILLQIERAAQSVHTFPATSLDVPAPRLPGWRRGPDGLLTTGRNPETPAYGDRRVQYRVVKIDPGVITLLCRQGGHLLEPEPAGPLGRPYAAVFLGQLDRSAAFAAARQKAGDEASHLLTVGVILVGVGVGLLAWTRRGSRPQSEHESQPTTGAAPAVADASLSEN